MNNSTSDIIYAKTITIDNKTTYTDRTVLNGITNLTLNAAVKSKSMVLSGGEVYINAPLKVNGTLLIHANHVYINADVQADYVGILSDDLSANKAVISAKKMMLLDIESGTTLSQNAKLKASKIFATKETAPGLPTSIKVQVMDKPMTEYKELKDAIAEVQKFGPFSTADVTFGAHNYEVNFNYHNGAESGQNANLQQIVESIFSDAGLKAPWVLPAADEPHNTENEVSILPVVEVPSVQTVQPIEEKMLYTPVLLDKPIVVDNTLVVAELQPVVIQDLNTPVMEVMQDVSTNYAEDVAEAAVIASIEIPELASQTMADGAVA